MIYKEYKGKQLSQLGFGTMRLPVIDGHNSKIEEGEAIKMMEYAYEHGINYFDTAWGYHAGNAELVTGKVLKQYPRESFYLADKFPGYDVANFPKAKEIFEKQLEKCQVEYFDFFLLHNLCELNIEEFLDPKYEIREYFLEQKKNGRIKHLGFSTHGNMETNRRFLEYYGDIMEFGQIQLNFMDYSFQKAGELVELLAEYNSPVWVMEPLRGGTILDMASPEECFRFVQNVPGVTVILSGMSNMEQLKDNLRIFETEEELSAESWERMKNTLDEKVRKGSVPCTACNYCTPHCPQEINIPWMMELYTEHKASGGGFIAPMALDAIEEGKKPADCIACGSCEAVCPQQIKISEVLKDFTEILKEK